MPAGQHRNPAHPNEKAARSRDHQGDGPLTDAQEVDSFRLLTHKNKKGRAMIKQSLLDALNQQINAEYYSSYLYLSMAGWFESHNLPGFANWMRVQVQEENFHMNRFFDYVLQRQGAVTLQAIPAPPAEWESALAIFEATYQHEQYITSLVHELVDLARREKDYATDSFLQWFVTEQVEEESNADGIIQKLRLMGGHGSGLFMVDRELATRVFVPPVIN